MHNWNLSGVTVLDLNVSLLDIAQGERLLSHMLSKTPNVTSLSLSSYEGFGNDALLAAFSDNALYKDT